MEEVLKLIRRKPKYNKYFPSLKMFLKLWNVCSTHGVTGVKHCAKNAQLFKT